MSVPRITDDERRAFADFEREGWDEVASNYASISDGLTSQVADDLLDAAGVATGHRVLDVATGPGWVAAAAMARGARVTGLDVSQAMADEARRRHAGLEVEVAPAEEMPFDDGSFDAVVSAFGMPHFADHAAVFAEARRVIVPGGRIAVASWNPPDRNAFFAVALGAIAQAGSLDVDLPAGVDMFTWADDEPCRALFEGAGFSAPMRTPIEMVSTSDDGPAEVLEVLRNASVRSRALYHAQTEEAKVAIERKIAELLEPMHRDGTWSLPFSAFILSATRS